MTTAILLVGHGTRRSVGRQEFSALVDMVEERLARLTGGAEAEWFVRFAYLELADPDIPTGIAACVAQGARRILLVPLMLFAAGHMKRDIPAAVHKALASRADGLVECLDAVDVDEVFARVAAARLYESGYPGAPDSRSAVVLLTRGNRDPEAHGRLTEFARLFEKTARAPDIRTCGLTGLGPTPENVFRDCEAEGLDRVFVVPYLLFRGVLTEETAARIAAWRSRGRDAARIVLAGHLGADVRLAERLAERIARRLWMGREAPTGFRQRLRANQAALSGRDQADDVLAFRNRGDLPVAR